MWNSILKIKSLARFMCGDIEEIGFFFVFLSLSSPPPTSCANLENFFQTDPIKTTKYWRWNARTNYNIKFPLDKTSLCRYLWGIYLKETVPNKELAEGKQMTYRTHLPFPQLMWIAYTFYFVLQGCPIHVNHKKKKASKLFVLSAEIQQKE